MPDLVITNILLETSNLFFPFIDNIISTSNLDERQHLVDDFKYTFENQMTIYKRNKNLLQNVIQPTRKAHGVKMKRKYDRKTQCYKQVPVTCTFTYTSILETLQLVFNNKAVQQYFKNDIVQNNSAYIHFVDGIVYKIPFFSNK